MTSQLDRIEDRLERMDERFVGDHNNPGILTRLDRIEHHIEGQKARHKTIVGAAVGAFFSFLGSLALLLYKSSHQ